MNLSDLEVGRWLPTGGIRDLNPPDILYNSCVSQRFVRRNTDGSPSYQIYATLKLYYGLGYSTHVSPGFRALVLAKFLRDCHTNGIEVVRTDYYCATNKIPTWSLQANYPLTEGEQVQFRTEALEQSSLQPKDILYVIGPGGEAQHQLIDIWVVSKVRAEGIMVSSLITPRKFSNQLVEWALLNHLLPVVILRGFLGRAQTKGTVKLSKQTVLLEDGTLLDPQIHNTKHYPPVVSGLVL